METIVVVLVRDRATFTARDLLVRFPSCSNETLVKQHGPMVLGICRLVLRRNQDAEDAFQATFLALAQGRHHS